jgi:hypothetical protein
MVVHINEIFSTAFLQSALRFYGEKPLKIARNQIERIAFLTGSLLRITWDSSVFKTECYSFER